MGNELEGKICVILEVGTGRKKDFRKWSAIELGVRLGLNLEQSRER